MPVPVLPFSIDRKLVRGCLALSVTFAVSFHVGCGNRSVEFDSNQVRAMSLERSRSVPTEAALEDVTAIVSEWFGTPGEPRWPAELLHGEEAKTLVSLARLEQAAGSVKSDEENRHVGLYQEHCVICHGVSGSGAGPASRFQVPYPRDFRAGVFKWKSTVRGDKPVRQDLERLLRHGIPGTPMPSFSTVAPKECDALVDYVVYLAVRGEVERELLALAVDELGYEEAPPEEDLRLIAEGPAEGAEAAVDVLNEVAEQWVEANVSPVAKPPSWDGVVLQESIARGEALFHGQIANCAACHGKGGTGGMPLLDYDDWTKDFTTRVGVTPDDRDAVKPFRKAGALPPRKIDPRVLAGGVLRGGADAETLYRRIQHGIAGTPMPSIEIQSDAGSKLGLTSDQVWDLVHYILSLVVNAPVVNALASPPDVETVFEKGSDPLENTPASKLLNVFGEGQTPFQTRSEVST